MKPSLDPSPSASPHRWRFFRAGGFDQVRIESGADLAALDSLDQKLWVALACPTRSIEFDPTTLRFLDTDNDGRIRAPEIIAAIRWIRTVLQDTGGLVHGTDTLDLKALNPATPEGRQLASAARQVLSNLGKPDAATLSLSDTADTARIFASTHFNGDGIVPAASAEDEPTRQVIADILACLGAETDRSGAPGISQALTDTFFAEAQAYSDWVARSEKDPASLLPLGDRTAAAHSALQSVRAKIDDYFARCRLAAFDARATAALNRAENEYVALAGRDLTADASEVRAFPIAHIEAGRPLPLQDGINPAWQDAVRTLKSAAVVPVLGDRTSLTESDWTALLSRLTPYADWQSVKPTARLEKLGLDRIREILSSTARQSIADLIAKDKALEKDSLAIVDLSRLLHYHRDLFCLLNNFVSFTDFYSRRRKAIFQSGTLYLDGRACELCVRVDDLAKHTSLAGLSRCYLAYCDCVRKSTGEKMTIAAAFTDGDADYLLVGRNGVFYDRAGRDWDATIAKVLENPISIRQAFWAPYKRVARMVEEQIEKAAASRDKDITAQAAAGVADAAKKTDAGKPAPAIPFDVAKFAGIFAAIGLAIGAIGGAVTSVAKGFFGLQMWQMPLAIGGALLLVSGPSMLLAFMKLRQRNLGPILDANGWAVNARARINVPFGASLTAIATLPQGSERSITDPYAQKRSAKPWIIILLVVLYFFLGKSWENGLLHEWTNGLVGHPSAAAARSANPTPTNPAIAAPPAASPAP